VTTAALRRAARVNTAYEVAMVVMVPLFVAAYDPPSRPPLVPFLVLVGAFVALWLDGLANPLRRWLPGKSVELVTGIHLLVAWAAAILFHWEALMQVAFLMVLTAAVRQRGSVICRPFQVWCLGIGLANEALLAAGVVPSRIAGPAAQVLGLLGLVVALMVVAEVCDCVAVDEAAAAARAAAEEAVRRREALAEALVRNSFDVIVVLDEDSGVTYASPAASTVVGVDPRELIGRTRFDVHPEDRGVVAALDGEAGAHPGEAFVASARVRHADGHWVHLEVVERDLRHDPLIRGLVVHARDVSEAHAVRERLLNAATRDPLTGLCNRRALMDVMDDELAAGQQLQVLFVDLDGFKAVNDRHGHDQGDELLAVVAGRLEEICEPGAVVARLAGDEFVVLLHRDGEDACELAEMVGASVRAPVRLAVGWARVGASIGVALSETGDTAADLLQRADAAMYRVKRRRGRTDEVAVQSVA
jgi:diguanylate cyclase (GGDEF)-like protein/PAS domain S-box-containing protein